MALFIGVEGLSLSAADRKRVQQKQTVAVILFSRNYQSLCQLQALTEEIRRCRPDILICSDHEGGRVQRFRQDFTLLPAAAAIGRLFDQRPQAAYAWAQAVGIIMGYELRQAGLDFSFAPVLDLQDAQSSVIGDRALHENPAVVAILSMALRRGLRQMGMAAVGKHYPGHGRVQGDSHVMLPCDGRSYEAREADRFAFFANVQDGIEAIMSAHIVLPEAPEPAGFSAACLNTLRQMGFEGAIISDDLDMAGAKFFSNVAERVQAALNAGADAAMICNTFADMDFALAQNLKLKQPALSHQRLQALRAQDVPLERLFALYQQAKEEFARCATICAE